MSDEIGWNSSLKSVICARFARHGAGTQCPIKGTLSFYRSAYICYHKLLIHILWNSLCHRQRRGLAVPRDGFDSRPQPIAFTVWLLITGRAQAHFTISLNLLNCLSIWFLLLVFVTAFAVNVLHIL